MSEHTPGPWILGEPSSVVGWPIVSQTGRAICSLNYVGDRAEFYKEMPGRAFNKESRANGHLIKAAPLMLAALKKVMNTKTVTHNLPMIMAAIAQAEGEEE